MKLRASRLWGSIANYKLILLVRGLEAAEKFSKFTELKLLFCDTIYASG